MDAAVETSTAEKTKIDIKDLCFFYGATKALKNITLPPDGPQGDRLHRPVGLRQVHPAARHQPHLSSFIPTSVPKATIILDGENILKLKDLNLLRARIGMVFQKPTPFPMSIYDNVAFGIKLYERMPRSEMDGRVEDALTRAALWGEVKDKLHASGLSLSGGQQQRLCIARTVATRPEVILLDEPCSALDPISTAKIEELIEELAADYTIVIVTHNMQQASRASRLHRLHVSGRAGRIWRDGKDLHRAG